MTGIASWNAFVSVCALLRAGGHGADLNLLPSAFTPSTVYICAFQHETTLLCLSVPALGSDG